MIDSAWFSQLQQRSVQEIPEVPVPSFLSRLPQPRNVVLDAPVRASYQCRRRPSQVVEDSSEAERWFDTLQSLLQSVFQRNARQERVQQPVVPGCRAAPSEGRGWRAGNHDRTDEAWVFSQAKLRRCIWGCEWAVLWQSCSGFVSQSR